MNKRVVITGAAGMIGIALAQYCVAQSQEVLAICHRGSSRNRVLCEMSGVEVLEADLEQYALLAQRQWEKQYDVFFHLAWAGTTGEARNDMVLQANNIRYTLDAVELAEHMGCHTFIGVGSQAEYGRKSEPLRPDMPTFPETGYGMAKLCAGQMSCRSCVNKGIRHIWARVLSVYGPYGGNDMITTALQKLMQGEHMRFTAGEQVWDYLYSEDAAYALWLMAERGISGKTYVLGKGQSRPLKEYLDILYRVVCEEMNSKGCRAGTIGIGEQPYGEDQLMHLAGDITELSRDTGFVPRFSFEAGVRRTMDAKAV